MPRLMSVALTEQAVVERRKTVTRRTGWSFLLPGDRLTLVRKSMGRKRGEPVVRLAEVEVVSVRRERLDLITDDDVRLEGFDEDSLLHYGPPGATLRDRFVRYFVRHMKGAPSQIVTRIEWKYLPSGAASLGGTSHE